jgi:hypothetical protein
MILRVVAPIRSARSGYLRRPAQNIRRPGAWRRSDHPSQRYWVVAGCGRSLVGDRVSRRLADIYAATNDGLAVFGYCLEVETAIAGVIVQVHAN